MESVYRPPRDTEGVSAYAVNLLVNLERSLLTRRPFRQVNPEDVRLGTGVGLRIEVGPRRPILDAVSRLALSDRVTVWITSEDFVQYGERYASNIEDWMEGHRVSERVRDRIGYTNILLPNHFILDPCSAAPVHGAFVESDIWGKVAQQQNETFHGQ